MALHPIYGVGSRDVRILEAGSPGPLTRPPTLRPVGHPTTRKDWTSRGWTPPGAGLARFVCLLLAHLLPLAGFGRRTHLHPPHPKLDSVKLAESVRSQRIVFGVDVAKEDFFGAVMDEQQRVLLTIRWKSPKQVRELVGLLRELPTTSLEVALEPSGTYGDALQVLLLRAGIPVHQVSPKRCHDAAEVYDGVPSQHDSKAAAIIAKLHLDGASRPWRDSTDQERELKAAVDLMSLYEEQFWALRNRLEARLARYWPELALLLPLDSATLIGLLAECGSPEQVAAHPEQARAGT